MASSKIIQNMTISITTDGAPEQTANIVANGAAAAASIAVATDTTLVISDLILGGLASAVWQLQQTNDGMTWFNIAQIDTLANTGGTTPNSPMYSYYPGLTITGGADVAIRMRVTTAGGAIAVIGTLRAYLEG